MNQHLPRLSFEQAKRAKAIGFDWPCRFYFGKSGTEYCESAINNWNASIYFSAPENSLFLQWVLQTHDFYGYVYPWAFRKQWRPKISIGVNHNTYGFFNSHPEAESHLIDEILAILEKQQNKTV